MKLAIQFDNNNKKGKNERKKEKPLRVYETTHIASAVICGHFAVLIESVLATVQASATPHLKMHALALY
jgi:hypothetical protein